MGPSRTDRWGHPHSGAGHCRKSRRNLHWRQESGDNGSQWSADNEVEPQGNSIHRYTTVQLIYSFLYICSFIVEKFQTCHSSSTTVGRIYSIYTIKKVSGFTLLFVRCSLTFLVTRGPCFTSIFCGRPGRARWARRCERDANCEAATSPRCSIDERPPVRDLRSRDNNKNFNLITTQLELSRIQVVSCAVTFCS